MRKRLARSFPSADLAPVERRGLRRLTAIGVFLLRKLSQNGIGVESSWTIGGGLAR